MRLIKLLRLRIQIAMWCWRRDREERRELRRKEQYDREVGR